MLPGVHHERIQKSWRSHDALRREVRRRGSAHRRAEASLVALCRLRKAHIGKDRCPFGIEQHVARLPRAVESERALGERDTTGLRHIPQQPASPKLPAASQPICERGRSTFTSRWMMRGLVADGACKYVSARTTSQRMATRAPHVSAAG